MATRARTAALRQLVYAHRALHGCCDCGEDDPFLLEHDHRDRAEKKADINRLVGAGRGLALLSELEKCDVRCKNCHRMRTGDQLAHRSDMLYDQWLSAERQGWGETLLQAWLAEPLPACAPCCSRCGQPTAPDDMKPKSGWCRACHNEHNTDYKRQLRSGRATSPRRVVTDTHAECCNCGMRPRENFGPDTRHGTPPSRCRACDSARKQESRNPQRERKQRDAIVLANARYYFAVKMLLGCFDCRTAGRDRRDPRFLEFHHLGVKTLGVGPMVSRGFSRDRIKAEIAQCVLLCGNCHRERTLTRPGWLTALPSFDELAATFGELSPQTGQRDLMSKGCRPLSSTLSLA